MTTNRKVVRTSVTYRELVAAQGGVDHSEDDTRLWVECPADYDADTITAEDIVHDASIRVVEVSR